ncbi:MAG: hypothetical protein KDK99_16580 [Verrucomicrobiales bacterium]|nr:hypothetical protein [Verrucomicrobiales bacterium]
MKTRLKKLALLGVAGMAATGAVQAGPIGDAVTSVGGVQSELEGFTPLVVAITVLFVGWKLAKKAMSKAT